MPRLLLLLVVVTSVVGTNLDFEQGTDDRDWPRHWYGGREGYEFSVDTTVAHSGKASARIEARDLSFSVKHAAPLVSAFPRDHSADGACVFPDGCARRK